MSHQGRTSDYFSVRTEFFLANRKVQSKKASMSYEIRWGIIGLGNIAAKFATALPAVEGARLVAVGSRCGEKAREFASRFGVSRCYGSYEQLASDPEIDAVYIATPHPLHCQNTIMCLEAGKAVLCEKPFAMNAGEALRMVSTARREGVFLMEAMWTRFIPLVGRVRGLLSEGSIGQVRLFQSDFGFHKEFDRSSRVFAPELGGGALLDVGVYPISFAQMLFGSPEKVCGYAHRGRTGVDEHAGVVMKFPGGEIAALTTAVTAFTPQETHIIGTTGRIRINNPCWVPRSMAIVRQGKADEVIHIPFESNGYNYEAQELGRCVDEGRLESAVMPLADTLAVMKVMDTLREQWGLKYPGEPGYAGPVEA